MRFSIAALTALAAGAFASDVVYETVTHYTTYCPEATSLVHGSHTYSISTPGHITMTHGPFTVTRPLITQTVTQCNKCSSSTPLPTTPVVSVNPAASTPVAAPSGAAATGAGSGASASGTASPAASQTPFSAGAVNAASAAGAGLAAVFGAAALLL